MSEPILYYPESNPGDIQQLHPDGGGIVMTGAFKAIIGETNNNVIENLNNNFYRGEIKTIPNNMSGLWILSQTSPALKENITLGNDNLTSLISQNQTPVKDEPKTTDCDNIGTILTNLSTYKDKQFEETTELFSKHEDAYSTPNWAKYDNNKTKYPNGTADLEWGRFGSGRSNFESQREYVFTKYWSTNENIEVKFNLNSYTGNKKDLNKLMIYTLPTGIRPYSWVSNYNGADHISRILNTIYKLTNGRIGYNYIQTLNITPGDFPEDEKNLFNANGATYKREETGAKISKKDQNGNDTYEIIKYKDTISKPDRAIYFIKIYDEIIKEYDKDKDLFLNTLKTETDNFYKRFIEFRYDQAKYNKDNNNRFITKKAKLQQFYNEFINLAQTLSNKAINCTNNNAIPPESSPTNPPTDQNGVGKPDDDERPQYTEKESKVSKDVEQEITKTPINGSTSTTGVNNSNSIPENTNNSIIETVVNGDNIDSYSEEDGLYSVDFNNLPNYETVFNSDLFNPESVFTESTSVSEADLQTNFINVSKEGAKYSDENTKPPGIYPLNILTTSGRIKDTTILDKVMTLKNGVNNVIELSLRENPTNYPFKNLINPNLPKFLPSNKCGDNPNLTNPILVAIGNTLGPFNGIFGRPSKYCASGLSFSWLVYNSTRDELQNGSTNTGGFPCSSNSYIVPSKEFTGAKESFIYNVDFDISSGKMNESGLKKWEKVKQYKGAIYTVGDAKNGHIGFILYFAKTGVYSDFLSLEWNWGKALKFVHHRFGASFGSVKKGNLTNIYIGDTSNFNGGSYAPNGLGTDYNLTGLGSVYSFFKNNFPFNGKQID